MAINTSQRMNSSTKSENSGFALLIAVIFVSVMLAFSLLISSLAYKQSTLANAALNSQTAFYAADAGLECLLYADQKKGAFLVAAPSSVDVECAGKTWSADLDDNGSYKYFTVRVETSERTCADLTIYKYSEPQGPDKIVAYLFSQGYSTTCEGVDNNTRFSARGIQAHY